MNINSGSRKISRSLVVISMLLCLIPVVCAAEHAPDSIIIKLKPGKKASEIGLLNSSVRATKRHAIKDIGYYSFKLPKGADLEKVIERYQKHPAVEYAGPNHTLRIAAVFPDDPVFYYGDEFWGVPQWGLYNDVGTPGADIHAVDAWEITTGSPDVLIAVIDTGIVPDHPDLADKIWTNPGEIPDNGIDDDNNGYVDDVNGWNFIDNDNFPLDDHYITHGTMVAGIAAAAGNNMEGIAGVAWGCPILPCKVIASNGYGLEDDAARAVVYAVDLGAKVINMSLSGDHTPALEAAIDYAWSKGCLCVCASGNENRSTPTYPASYTNALAVGASNEFDQRCTALDWGAGGSNYGSYLDVVAPGSYIVSCGYFLYDLGLAYEPYDTQSGTSAAAPFVSGVAALIWSIHPEWTNAMVKHHIEHTADDITDYGVGFDIHTGWGRVNAYRALSEPIATVQTVSEIKYLSPGSVIMLSDKVLSTASGQLANRLYVQDENRASGTLLYFSGTGVPGDLKAGEKISILGTVTNINGEIGILNPQILSKTTGAAPKPLGMNNKTVGGGPAGNQKAVVNHYSYPQQKALGINNIGLLVTTFGKVTAVGSNYFYIDDGSKLRDDTGNTGIRVYFDPNKLQRPDTNQYVIITGISSCEFVPESTEHVRRILRPRVQQDIRILK